MSGNSGGYAGLGAGTAQAGPITLAAALTETADAAAGISTSYVMSVGDTFSGTRSAVTDDDWVRIDLTAGNSISIALDGVGVGALADPLVRLFDSTGTQLAFNDDGGVGRNSLLSYVVPTTGTYYIDAAAWNSASAGDYQITVTNAGATLPVFTGDQIATYLRSGFWADFGSTQRAFTVGVDNALNVDITSLTAAGQQLATWALDAWTDVTGIAFNFVDETLGAVSEIFFDDNQSGAFSNSTISGGTISRSTVNISTAWLAGSGTTLDSYSFQTYIHELGHALGLGHAGNYNGSATYGTTAATGDNHYLNDSWQATVMSYMSQTNNTFINASYAFIATPMIADILAIQSIYGTNTGQRTGDTVYGENSTAGGYLDQLAALDINAAGTPVAFTVFDGGGIDTLDFGSATAAQVINMGGESISDIYGIVGALSIARGTVIENLISGSGSDTITGNAANNVITGGGGADTIDGGAGTDTAVFAGLRSAYAINTVAGTTTVTTGGVTATLTNVENVQFADQTLALGANTAPVSTVADLGVNTNEWTRLSTVLGVVDADGDAITQYGILDTTGGNNWWADGGYVDASAGYTSTNLAGIWFRGDASASTQTLSVRAHDGTAWGAWDQFILTTNANTAPVSTVADLSVATGQWTRLNTVLGVVDADGDAITSYQVWDSTGGNNWWADGGTVDASTGYTTNNLSGIWFQGDASASSQTLWVRANDGTDWGAWDSFNLTTTNVAPVATVADQAVAANSWTRLSSVLNLSDADGNAITQVEVWDSTGGNNWWANGGTVDASTGYTTADIGGIWFQGDAAASTQTLWVRAYDGTDWGAWDSFALLTA